MRTSVRFASRRLNVGNFSCEVHVEYPAKDTEIANVLFTLRVAGFGDCEVKAHFDGFQLVLGERRYKAARGISLTHENLVAHFESRFFSNPDAAETLFPYLRGEWKFERLGKERKNVSFLPALVIAYASSSVTVSRF